ncbi:adenylyltransferase/cytidyltransferase family protein [Agrobacterium vitis]|uniref:adenylyltransferase/cytidyltransferase family protein n=1 Tax=Agrobacterium vitis TaxID=373 RepID=UPI0018D24650|nr:adenylyltransferase/cytidyltransferase family protein [Agrobacterium vitis]
MKTVYVAMCADVVHRGHINILAKASQYGRVVVGLLSDEAVASFKRVPFMSYEDRFAVISNLSYVDEVIMQDATTPAPYIIEMKPEIFVHGDDWCYGKETFVRDRVVEALATYGGQLVEVPYTKGVSSTQAQRRLRDSEAQLKRNSQQLAHILNSKKVTRACFVTSEVQVESVGQIAVNRKAFDAVWYKVEPGTLATDLNHYFNLMRAGTKPLIVDCHDISSPVDILEIACRAIIMGVAGICLNLGTLTPHPGLLMQLNATPGFDSLLLFVKFQPAELAKLEHEDVNLLKKADVVVAAIETPVDLDLARNYFTASILGEEVTKHGYAIPTSSALTEDMLHEACNIFVLHTPVKEANDVEFSHTATAVLETVSLLYT